MRTWLPVTFVLAQFLAATLADKIHYPRPTDLQGPSHVPELDHELLFRYIEANFVKNAKTFAERRSIPASPPATSLSQNELRSQEIEERNNRNLATKYLRRDPIISRHLPKRAAEAIPSDTQTPQHHGQHGQEVPSQGRLSQSQSGSGHGQVGTRQGQSSSGGSTDEPLPVEPASVLQSTSSSSLSSHDPRLYHRPAEFDMPLPSQDPGQYHGPETARIATFWQWGQRNQEMRRGQGRGRGRGRGGRQGEFRTRPLDEQQMREGQPRRSVRLRQAQLAQRERALEVGRQHRAWLITERRWRQQGEHDSMQGTPSRSPPDGSLSHEGDSSGQDSGGEIPRNYPRGLRGFFGRDVSREKAREGLQALNEVYSRDLTVENFKRGILNNVKQCFGKACGKKKSKGSAETPLPLSHGAYQKTTSVQSVAGHQNTRLSIWPSQSIQRTKDTFKTESTSPFKSSKSISEGSRHQPEEDLTNIPSATRQAYKSSKSFYEGSRRQSEEDLRNLPGAPREAFKSGWNPPWPTLTTPKKTAQKPVPGGRSKKSSSGGVGLVGVMPSAHVLALQNQDPFAPNQPQSPARFHAQPGQGRMQSIKEQSPNKSGSSKPSIQFVYKEGSPVRPKDDSSRHLEDQQGQHENGDEGTGEQTSQH